MTPDAVELIRDFARFARAVEHLFVTLPESYHAGHLSAKARALYTRADDMVGRTEGTEA